MQFEAFSRISGAEPGGLAVLEAAESHGYAAAWLGEALPHHGLDATTHLALAGLAGRTTRISIGAAITLQPNTHPLRLAEEIAMLDIMSGGRFQWSAGLPSDDSPEGSMRLREQLEIVDRALSGERFSYAGEFFDVPELQCLPAPERQPHPAPALWMETLPRAAAGLATERAHAVVVGPDASVEEIEQAPELRRQGLALLCRVHVGAADRSARANAERALADVAHDMETATGPGDRTPCNLFGDAARCRDDLAELLARTGADTLIAWHDFDAPGRSIPRDAALASQRRLLEEVAPAFG